MPDKPDEKVSETFEEFVAAALKVDPKGLSGKHRRDGDDHEDDDTEKP